MAEKINIFNNPYKTIESWSAQGAVINWGTSNTPSAPIPLIANSLNLTYAQQVSSIYPLNTSPSGAKKKINIKGAPNGNLTIGSVFSPTHQNLAAFIQAVTKDCKTENDQVTITIRPFGDIQCDTEVGTVLYLTGVDCSQIQLGIQGGEVAIVNMPMVFTFTGLDWEF